MSVGPRASFRAAGFCVVAGFAVLVLGIAPVHAEQGGKVYLLVNPQAPRAEWERRPLPGAYVAVSWSVTIPAPAHAVDSCRYSELARTDEKGEYVMEGPNPITAGLAHSAYSIYSPGLEPVPFPAGGSEMLPKDITMTFSTRTPEDRLSRLSMATHPGCGGGELSDPRSLFLPYLRALLEEAKALKVETDRGRSDVRSIEATLRRATGDDRPPQKMRVVPLQGGVEAAKVPAQR